MFSIIFICFFKFILKNNYTPCKIIENKTLNIKIIFKNIKSTLKVLYIWKKTFIVQNFRQQFSKNFKTIFKHSEFVNKFIK